MDWTTIQFIWRNLGRLMAFIREALALAKLYKVENGTDKATADAVVLDKAIEVLPKVVPTNDPAVIKERDEWMDRTNGIG